MAVPVAERPADTTLQLPEVEPEQHLALYDVAWEDYEAIGEALRDRSNLRLTYDNGTLEIMTTSSTHEILKKRLGRLVETLAEELGRKIAPGGSFTIKNQKLEKGLEPDDCFWVANEAAMRGKLKWDPAAHPPPDLVIEVEVSRNVVDRLPVLAALRVPEVWRFGPSGVAILILQPGGLYSEAAASLAFPDFPVAELARFCRPDEEVDYLSEIRAFRSWVRERLEDRR